jgi:hypothetical protein
MLIKKSPSIVGLMNIVKMNYIRPRRASKPLPVADSRMSRMMKPSMAKRPFQSSACGVKPYRKEFRFSEFPVFISTIQDDLHFLIYLYQMQDETCTKGQVRGNFCKKRACSNRNKTGLELRN